MRNDDQWHNRRRDESDTDREFARDRDEGAGSRYPHDEPFQFGDTDRAPKGGSYRESGRQYGGYDQPGRGDPYADEGGAGGSRHEGYGLTGQRYGHEEEFSSQGWPRMNREGHGQRHPQYDWPSRGVHEGREQDYGGWQGGRQSSQRYMPKGYKRSDARLQEDICERLSRSGLDVSEVSVSVADGHVTLEGSVNERYIKHAIEDCVDDCMGIEGIENRIRVARPGSRPETGSAGEPGSLFEQASSSGDQARPEAGASDKTRAQANTTAAESLQGGTAEQPARSPRKSSGQSKRK